MRILLLASLLIACNASRPTPAPVEAKVGVTATPPPAHGSGRERWRGGGVYLDGVPIGMLRYAELPAGLEPIYETQRHRLPFRAGEPVRYRESKVPRYRITDYLSALGIPLDDITQVHMLGARNSAIVLTRDDLRHHPDDVLFKFAGDTFGKPIPIIRKLDVGTSFDDLMALTIYVKRTPPSLAADQTLELDGITVRGIAYRGEPLREGVRIYVDNRLATVLKRNQLEATGAKQWQLGDVLARQGIATARITGVALIHNETRSATMPWSALVFGFNAGASGEIVVGTDATPTSSIALFTSETAAPTTVAAIR